MVLFFAKCLENMTILAWDSKWKHRVDGIGAVVPGKSSHQEFVNHASTSNLRFCRNFVVTPISKRVRGVVLELVRQLQGSRATKRRATIPLYRTGHL